MEAIVQGDGVGSSQPGLLPIPWLLPRVPTSTVLQAFALQGLRPKVIRVAGCAAQLGQLPVLSGASLGSGSTNTQCCTGLCLSRLVLLHPQALIP